VKPALFCGIYGTLRQAQGRLKVVPFQNDQLKKKQDSGSSASWASKWKICGESSVKCSELAPLRGVGELAS
jgi:hypothetical protein